MLNHIAMPRLNLATVNFAGEILLGVKSINTMINLTKKTIWPLCRN